jgi:shikimate dehydrogenase
LSRRVAVVGSPIQHSLSPALHRAAYRELGLDWSFERIEVAAGGLADFCAGLGPRWRGLAVTMPLKPEALALAAVASPVAGAAAAANTLLLDGGRWSADNTDVAGVQGALRERGAGGRSSVAAVLGGGATARSAVVALAELAEQVHVYVRSAGRAEGLLDAGRAAGVPVSVRAWSELRQAWVSPLVVATTPAGALDEAAAGVPERVEGVLLDVTYAPWPSRLATRWGRSGGAVAGGLDLLVHQARAQVRLMTGRDVDVEVLRAAGRSAQAAGAAGAAG